MYNYFCLLAALCFLLFCDVVYFGIDGLLTLNILCCGCENKMHKPAQTKLLRAQFPESVVSLRGSLKPSYDHSIVRPFPESIASNERRENLRR